MKPLWEIAADLRAGRLLPELLDHPPAPVPLSVLYPHRRLLPARVKAFADFAVTQVGAEIRRELDGLSLEALRQTSAKPRRSRRRS